MSEEADDVLAPMAPRIEKVEFEGKISYVRRLNVDEQIKFEAECSVLDKDDPKGYMVASLAFYVCKADGSTRYSIAEARAKIGAADKGFVQAVMKKGQAINHGIAPEAVEKAAKN
jgi:hypothetical protein